MGKKTMMIGHDVINADEQPDIKLLETPVEQPQDIHLYVRKQQRTLTDINVILQKEVFYPLQ